MQNSSSSEFLHGFSTEGSGFFFLKVRVARGTVRGKLGSRYRSTWKAAESLIPAKGHGVHVYIHGKSCPKQPLGVYRALSPPDLQILTFGQARKSDEFS